MIFNGVSKVQTQVLENEVRRWKQEQQLEGNGKPMTFPLETLQEWCEGLADINWPLRQQITQLIVLSTNLSDSQCPIGAELQKLMTWVTDLLSTLVSRYVSDVFFFKFSSFDIVVRKYCYDFLFFSGRTLQTGNVSLIEFL